MGYYINPQGMTKQDWLNANGTRLGSTPPNKWRSTDNEAAVCLIDNGPFTTAGIAYCANEFEVFKAEDGRHKVWYYVPMAKLAEVEPRLLERVWNNLMLKSEGYPPNPQTVDPKDEDL